MEDLLKDLLSNYLGELLHKQENEFDWLEKDKITEKLNACCVLLDIPASFSKSVDWRTLTTSSFLLFPNT